VEKSEEIGDGGCQEAPLLHQVLEEIVPGGPIGNGAFHHNDHFGVENANRHDPQNSMLRIMINILINTYINIY